MKELNSANIYIFLQPQEKIVVQEEFDKLIKYFDLLLFLH